MTHTLIDLYREYVRCADMCSEYNDEHKTNIQPRECLQLKSATGEWVGYFSLNEPNFAELLDHKIRFAVAILDGKPVFVGDIMFEKMTGDKVLISGINPRLIDFSGFSLEPPKKRTFTLNGVELPCPLKSEPCADNLNYATLCNDGKEFYFSCYEDKQNWRHAFSSLLEQARDKE